MADGWGGLWRVAICWDGGVEQKGLVNGRKLVDVGVLVGRSRLPMGGVRVVCMISFVSFFLKSFVSVRTEVRN